MSEPDTPSAGSRVAAARLRKGLATLGASTLFLLVLQAGYSAAAARVLGPDVFGAYAAAVVLGGLTALIVASALGQSVSRRLGSPMASDRAIFTYAWVVGLAGLVISNLLAEQWSMLWRVPDGVAVIRVISIGLPFAAVSSVASGILRREGRIPVMALRMSIAQAVGLLLGLWVVVAYRQPWTVGASLVIGQVLNAGLLLSLIRPAVGALPGPISRLDVRTRRYAVRAAPLALLRYLTTVLPNWAVGRFCGADALGTLNRASSVLTAPLDRLTTVQSAALFPELRTQAVRDQHQRALSDALALFMCLAIYLLGVGYFLAPPFLAAILGAGWSDVETMARVALLVGVVPLVGVPASNALEASGKFRPSAWGWALGALGAAVGVLLTAATGSLGPALAGLVVNVSAPAVFALLALVLFGWVRVQALFAGVRQMLAVQVAMTPILFIAASWGEHLQPITRLGLLVLVAVMQLGLMWAFRSRFTPYRMAVKYGLLERSVA